VSIWATLREAIRGTTEDLTSRGVPIRRAVLLLAIPTVLEMSMESLLTIVDIFVVSRLGSDAVATVGLTESMLSPAYALAMGLSAGATALVSRRVGEKDPEGAAIAAVQGIAACIVCAALVGAMGALLAPHLLALMGASPSVVALGARYTALMLGGSFTIFLLFVVNSIFRSAGDAATAMRTLWLANLLNIALAPCLVFGVGPFPRLGVLGAALAMTGSRGVGVLYQLFCLAGTAARGRARLVIRRAHLALRSRVLAELVRIAVPGTLQVLIETASWLALVRITSSYGSAALAGYTIATRVVVFALLPAWGLSSAASTLVGQNLGAKAPDRAERSVWTVARYNLLFLAPIGVVFALAPGPIASIFTQEPEPAVYAAACLRIVAVGFVAFAVGMAAIQAFNGAGDTRTPMLVNLASFWLFKIPLAWLLAKVLGFGPRGVFIAVTAAYSVQTVVAAVLFRRGKWKHTEVGGNVS
jgi:putative MATE family efflux protein